MKKEELIEQLESLNVPTMASASHQKHFKVYLLNTRRSAFLGLLLLVLPFFFVLSNVLEYVLRINPGIIRRIPDLFVYFDQTAGLWFLGPLLLLGGPVIAVLLNLLSVLHLHYDKSSRELTMTLRLKWINIAIVLVCTFVVSILLLYLIVENAQPH